MSAADALTRQAIDWLVLLDSGEASAADRRRFDVWLEKHPTHRDAWAHVSQTLDKTLSPLRERYAGNPRSAQAWREVIERPPRRRFLRGALAVAGVSLGGGLLLSRLAPFDELGADFASGTAERRRFVLSDGSTVELNARSAVNVTSDGPQRALRLKTGEILVTAKAGPTPLRVDSEAVRMISNGGRFMVRREAARTLVAALEQPLAIERASGYPPFALAAGSGAYVADGAITPYQGDASALAAWQHGLLEVGNQPLGQVVDALRAYRHGYIRIAPAAARLRVLGVFPLDDTDRALDLLAATLPIRLTRYGRWLVLIEPADGAPSTMA